MNIVTIIGNVCADPKAHKTQSGISNSSFTVAVQRKFKNSAGNYDADFLPIVAWRGTADFCNKYLTKGRKVAITGSLQTRSYDAQDGSKRYVVEIIADHVETLDKLQEGEQRPADAPKAANAGEFVEVDNDDSLPF